MASSPPAPGLHDVGAPAQDLRVSPLRLIEFFRRIILLGGLLATTWLALMPAPALVRVEAIDFTQQQQRRSRSLREDLRRLGAMTGIDATAEADRLQRKSLDEYIAAQTRDRLVVVPSNAWNPFFRSIEDNLAGQSESLAFHRSSGTGSTYLYFKPDDLPTPDVLARIRGADPFTYVQMDGTSRHLGIVYQRTSDAWRYAPSWLMYPSRPMAVWAFIAALVGYALLPWPRIAPNALVYSRTRSIVVPDLLGACMAAAFFALPFLVLTANLSSSEEFALLSFDGGWAWLTIILWAFVIGGISISAVSLWYATFALLLEEDGLRRVTLFGQRHWPYSQMVAVEPAHWSPPRWFKILMLIGAVLSPRHAGAMILGSTRESWGIRIGCRDGQALTVWLQYMPGFERLFHALKRAGVPLNAELNQIIDDDLASGGPPQTAISPRARIIGFALLTVMIAAALFIHFRPVTPAPLERPSPPISVEAVQRRQAILQSMQGLQQRMKAIIAEVPTASGDARDALLRENASLMSSFQKLHDEFESISIYEPAQPTTGPALLEEP